ncbi:TPA: hypothetical protein NQE99_003646 [Klebsiella variicola]|nr:hypothetical protein [Klebsiella variicola]
MTQAAQSTDDHEDATSRYYKAENRLFHAKTVENKATGVVIKMTNNLEKLYTYMLNQYKWYYGDGGSNKRPFAESQVRLGTAARIGDPIKNTKRYIDELIALGLVSILVKSKQKGVCDVYKVFEVDEVAKNLVFTYPEFEGKPLYDHEQRLGKDKHSSNQAAQQEAPQAQQEQHPLADADEPAPDEEVSPDVVTDKPVPSTEVEIFDQNGVITEAFIRLSGADLNEDGTLKSGWYVYAYARAEQARRDGLLEGLSDAQLDDAWVSYKAAAKPEYIPQHLHSPAWFTPPEQQNQQSQPTEAA